jgi:hypothetical protein
MKHILLTALLAFLCGKAFSTGEPQCSGDNRRQTLSVRFIVHDVKVVAGLLAQRPSATRADPGKVSTIADES